MSLGFDKRAAQQFKPSNKPVVVLEGISTTPQAGTVTRPFLIDEPVTSAGLEPRGGGGALKTPKSLPPTTGSPIASRGVALSLAVESSSPDLFTSSQRSLIRSGSRGEGGGGGDDFDINETFPHGRENQHRHYQHDQELIDSLISFQAVDSSEPTMTSVDVDDQANSALTPESTSNKGSPSSFGLPIGVNSVALTTSSMNMDDSVVDVEAFDERKRDEDDFGVDEEIGVNEMSAGVYEQGEATGVNEKTRADDGGKVNHGEPAADSNAPGVGIDVPAAEATARANTDDRRLSFQEMDRTLSTLLQVDSAANNSESPVAVASKRRNKFIGVRTMHSAPGSEPFGSRQSTFSTGNHGYWGGAAFDGAPTVLITGAEAEVGAEVADTEKLRAELLKLQYALSIERRKGRPMKQVAGAQFRLPRGPTLLCEHCLTTDNSVRLLKGNVRHLRIELARANEEIVTLRKNKSFESANNMVRVRDDLLATQATLVKKTEELEAEVANWRKKHNADQAVIQYQKKQVSELQEMRRANRTDSTKKLEKEKETTKMDELKWALAAMTGERDDLLDVIEKLKAGINEYKSQLDLTEIKVKAVRRKTLEAKERNEHYGIELGILKTQLFEKAEENSQIVLKIAKMGSEISTLGSIVSELQESNRKLNETRSELQQKLRMAAKDADANTRRFNETVTLLTESQTSRRELEEALERAHMEQTALKTQANAAKEEADHLQSQLAELTARMVKESEAVRKTLESTMSSAVRLCVVAPTVNVQVGDKTLRLQSGLPENSIHDFIVDEVLAQYTFLFKQMEESSGPDGSNLQTWIQKMLYVMQDSIEHHIQAAMFDT